jgi:hypothetical protein
MRPNLSLESIAGALAVLGTGVLMAACGGQEPKTPVNANEVSGATTSADGAGHCGAGKEHKAGEAACAADKKAATDVKPADPTAAAKPDTTAAAATPADAKPVAGAPTPATPAKKPGTPTPPTAAKKGGASSCGAGTCSAKK